MGERGTDNGAERTATSCRVEAGTASWRFALRRELLGEVTRKESQEEGAQGGYSQQHKGMARLQVGHHLHCWRECLGKLWWEGGVRLRTGEPWPAAESSVSYFVCGKMYPTEIIHQMEPSKPSRSSRV